MQEFDHLLEKGIVAQGLSKILMNEMKNYAKKVWKGLRLSHLSRIDFFLDKDQNIRILAVSVRA